MHFLDGLVGEDLALDTTKSYLRQAVYIGIPRDLKKFASIGSFQERNETKNHVSHTTFGFQAPSEKTVCYEKSAYILRRPQNFAKSPPYFCLYVL